MRPCSYCGRLVRDEHTYHKLGSTSAECPASWRPWERRDYRAVRRGEWWIKFQGLPRYVYLVKRMNGDFLHIPPFAPYLTAPTHPYVYDLVAARIPAGY